MNYVTSCFSPAGTLKPFWLTAEEAECEGSFQKVEQE
jgi:hypothetical protein